MSKATRNRTRNARERIAAQQAAARKAEQRRRLLIVGGSVGLVLVIVVVFIFVYSLRKPGKPLGSGPLPPAVTRNITNVPATTLSKIGTGAVPALSSQTLQTISDKPLTNAGKPEMLYIGAEFCPFCAAMRWSMAISLSKFGTLGPLTGIHSAPAPETDPNTATLTFRSQKYTSPYLTFTAIEHQTVTHKLLQHVTKQQNDLWVKYDNTPGQGPGYPFIDFGNKVVIKGPLFNPAVLHGLTWSQIAGQLKDPTSPVAMNINGAANYITASICKMTGNKPAAVCTAGPIPAIEAKL
jgi:hypothetical protein